MSSGTGSDAAYDLVVVGGNSGGLSVAIATQTRRARPGPDPGAVVGGGVHRADRRAPARRGVRRDRRGDRPRRRRARDHHQQGRLPGPGLRGGAPHQRRQLRLDAAVRRRRCPTGSRSTASPGSSSTRTSSSSATPTTPSSSTDKAAMAGARVVLAAGGMTPKRLSPIGQTVLRRLERERLATILFRSVPDRITEEDGLPLACFADRRTPDLEFDKVIFASGRIPVAPDAVGLTEAAAASGRVWFLGLPTGDEKGAPVLTAADRPPRAGRPLPAAQAAPPKPPPSRTGTARASPPSSRSSARSTTTPPSPTSSRPTPTCGCSA